MNIQRKFLITASIIFIAFSVKAQAPKMNNAPLLNSMIPVQEVYYGKYFEFTISENTFIETDDNDKVVRYEAHLFNGSTLPNWIYFKGEELKFWGRPEKQDKGEYYITLKAFDTHEAVSMTEFLLIVK
jgi:hypothetical protein